MSDLPNITPKVRVPEKLSADELFPERKYTPDELFPRNLPVIDFSGMGMDQYFSEGSTGRVLDLFGKGASRGWGTRPLGLDSLKISDEKDAPSVTDWLRKEGIFNDFKDGQGSLLKQFSESLFRGTAAGIDALFRAPIAAYYGVGDVAEAAGVPRDIVGIPEAFPFGHATAFPMAVPPRVGLRHLEEAADLGIIGDGRGAGTMARESLAPDTTPPVREPAPTLTTPDATPAAPPQPSDVHAAARIINPDLIEKFDTIKGQRQELSDMLGELRTERDAPAQARIDDILGKVNGVEDRLTNRAALRLDLARKELEEIQSVDSPTMGAVRKQVQELDYQLRDLAPEYTETYREAQRQLDAEKALEESPVTPIETTPVTPVAESVAEAPTIDTLSQRRPTIMHDVQRQLIEAGRSPEEGQAAGALLQAHYEARAARLGEPARDLYDREAPTITGSTGSGPRGQYNIAKNEITFFRNADASTFLHETGHNWLLEMQRDVKSDAAPMDLKGDWQTVKDWLKVGDEPLARKDHEKFARGFERYLMEGQAPSPKLATVFEKFKDWLTQIYQTVSRLRSPINDDIRGVFDRLISKPNSEPVITPERVGAEDFSAFAERSARETPLSEARSQADFLRAQRNAAAQNLSREVDDGRRSAQRDPERVIVPEREGVGPGTLGERSDTPPADAAVGEGGNSATGESTAPSSATTPFQPVDQQLVDKEGNFRVENIDRPEDVGAAIREAAGKVDGHLTPPRTELSDVEALNLADSLGVRASLIDKAKIGSTFNAEQMKAAGRLLVESETHVRDTMAKAASGDEQGLIDYAIARERHLMLQDEVRGITSEAGRALQAVKSISGLRDAELLSTLLQKTLGKTKEDLMLEARLGMTLDSPAKLNKFLVDQNRPGFANMVIEAWINGLLSGPYTHVRNMVGNAAVAVNSVVETAGAAAVSKLRGTDAVQFAEVGDRVSALVQGSQEGVIAFGKALKDEGYADSSRQLETNRRAIPDVNIAGFKVPLGQAVRLPGRFLAAEDEFFKAVAFRQQINVLARRLARIEAEDEINVPAWRLIADNKGVDLQDALNDRTAELLRDPTDEMIAAAKDHARYQTFQNDLGPLGNSLIQFANSHPLARLVFPFIRTPANILKYANERMPTALFQQKVRDNLLGRNGDVAKDTQIARLALGSTFMTAMAGLAYKDFVTGGGPADPNENRAWRADGKQPYSVKIGNTWVSYANLDPMTIPISIASDMAEAAKAGPQYWKNDEMNKLAVLAVTGVSRDVLSKLSFRGAATLIQAITEPANYGPRFIQQQAASLVPAFVKQGAAMHDPFMREVRTVTDSLMAGVPYVRETIAPSRDVFGDEIRQQEIGPINISQQSSDPVRTELARLGMGVAKADHKIEGVELTGSQYDDYSRIAGRFTKMLLDKMVDGSEWGRIPDGIKKTLIHDQIKTGHEVAKATVQGQAVGSDNDLIMKALQKQMERLR